MTTDPTGRNTKPEACCDLCGGNVRIVNSVDDDFGSYTICAGCAELWTTYLMHHPSPRRYHAAEDDQSRGRRPA